MRKLYSLVLMAAALLIGTNAWAGITREASTDGELQSAWAAAQDGDEIKLTANVTLSKALWLGTATMESDTLKSITLDLNGKTLDFANALNKPFFISHGELIVKNGQIVQSGTSLESSFVVFTVTGSTYNTVNPKTAESGYYSHLVIEDDVTLTAKANAIVVDRFDWTTDVVPTEGINKPSAWSKLNTNALTTDRGLANGARIDVYGKIRANKYAIKSNGNLGGPSTAKTARPGYWADADHSAAYAVDSANFAKWAPFIYIHSTADLLTTSEDSYKAVAAYGGGYARWLVEGKCVGSTGVYVKSGEVVLHDAVIASNYSQTTYKPAVGSNSGVTSGGSGIVMESSTVYAGDIAVTVQGDTKVTPTSGYAIDEAVTATSGTKVDAIEIEGGTFEAGTSGTIKVTETTAAAAADENQETKITILGGNSEGGATIGNQTLEQFLTTQQGENAAYATVIDDGNGGTTIVINQGTAPASRNWSDIIANPNAGGNWEEPDTVEISSDLTLGELLMNAGTEGHLQQITVQDGATFTVDHLVMNAHARIIVEAGSTFIVKGNQGIVAPVVDNIVLKASEFDQATFLFNPAVASNRHPNATVEFVSRSFRVSSTEYRYQRFGIPTFGALKRATAERDGNPAQTAFATFDGNNWNIIGYIHTAGQTMDYSKMANPFEYYQMLNNVPTEGNTLVRMEGELYGNENPELKIGGNRWNGFANSFMAPIEATQLLSMIPSTVDRAFYLNRIGAEQATWDPYTYINLEEMPNIAAMQPFLICNRFGAANALIDYNEAVYKPATSVPNLQAAASRRAASDITKAQINVKGENGTDRVIVAENADFSAEFDNGYDAAKYMNEGINVYVSADEKMSIFATDNLDNTYVGLQTVNGGNYTIEFTNVQGAELTLIDHETGARVAMVEGSIYEFTANGTNDYRFEIVNTVNAPTAIENTEAVKSAKGIYTITGQFVGEMNVWNTLPAGIYVVNGEKRVK